MVGYWILGKYYKFWRVPARPNEPVPRKGHRLVALNRSHILSILLSQTLHHIGTCFQFFWTNFLRCYHPLYKAGKSFYRGQYSNLYNRLAYTCLLYIQISPQYLELWHSILFFFENSLLSQTITDPLSLHLSWNKQLQVESQQYRWQIRIYYAVLQRKT